MRNPKNLNSAELKLRDELRLIRRKRTQQRLNALKNIANRKPSSDTSHQKQRTCNGPECSQTFISEHFGHRNCGCMKGQSATLQELYA